MADANPVLPPAIFLSALILMAVLHFFLPGSVWLAFPWRLAGIVPVLAGIWMNGRSARLFEVHGTEIKPFRASSALVTSGPYTWSRNPMYLGMVTILAGIAVFLGSLTPWLVVPVFIWVVTVRFVFPEERSLERQFGEAYREYRARVSRWI